MWKNQKMIQLHNKLSIADVTVITGYIIAVIAVGLWVGVYSFFFLFVYLLVVSYLYLTLVFEKVSCQ